MWGFFAGPQNLILIYLEPRTRIACAACGNQHLSRAIGISQHAALIAFPTAWKMLALIRGATVE